MTKRSNHSRRRRSPLHKFARTVSVLLLLVFVALAALATPTGRVFVTEAIHEATGLEKRVRLGFGIPLRGTPDLTRFDERLAEKGLKVGDPVFIRIFKQESQLELWMKKGPRFVRFASYPICRWSGRLGPKLKEGDRQSPEGFYMVSRGQLNPNSAWHRSFNLGFPNRFDKAHGRTGSFLMVHGGCGSIGCYAMTDPVIDEIWRLVTAALKKGQPRFHVHVFPFRMNQWKLALNADSPWRGFWKDLQAGHDLFEASNIPPRISVCKGRYVAREGRPGSRGDSVLREDCGPRLTKS